MNNVLLYLGGLLVVTLAALFAVPHFIDWNGYRGVFEEEATKVLGRDVRVGGAVNVRFLPTPYVRFEKVRLADPTGQTGEPFVRIDSFTMRLSGPALLRGVLEANEIELHRPVLTLALDAQGGGNWTSVQIKPGALPFVPKDVALHSVKIIDGAIGLFNGEAQPIARAEAVNGEFSADALKGPFKFKGQAKWSGEVRDVKFATTVPDANGAFQIKANARVIATATSYALDGRVEDLSTKPRLTGELTGKIPLTLAGEKAGSEKKQADAIATAETPVMELRALVDATTAGAKVEEILFSLENAAEPQLITGSAQAQWGIAPRLDIALTSKWLDLDRLSGAGQDSATFFKVKQFGLSMLRSLAGDGAANAKIEVDQVKLGGETAGALKIDAGRQGSAVQLRQLKAGLPGGSRFDLSGDLKDDNGKVSFAGSGFVHGSNFSRLLAWAAKSGADLDIKADGAFAAEGRVLINDTRFELTEAAADIGGRTFSGDVVVSGDDRRKVAVTLEGARLDSSELFPEMSKALEANLRRAFGIGSAADAEQKTAAPAAAPGKAAQNGDANGDISVRVLAGELKHGDRIFRNVDATVGLDGGNIRIPSARFTTASGLTVALDARITNTADHPKGTLAYDVVALTPDALKDLASGSGLAAMFTPERIAQAGSARLAGLVRLGARGKSSADVSFDGTVQTARVSGHADFDGGLAAWRTEPSRLQLTARAQGFSALLAALGIEARSPAQPSAHEAEFVYVSTGTLAAGSSALADLTAPGFEMAYNGSLRLPDNAPSVLSGMVRIKADDALDAFAVSGLAAARGLGGTPLEGTFEIARDAGAWTIATRKLLAGGSALNGTAKLVTGAPHVLTAEIEADGLGLAGLLAPVLDADATATADAKHSVWPGARFQFEPLSNVTGVLNLRYGTLQIQPGLSAHNGAFKIAFAPGKVALSDMTGSAAGGALTGGVQLSKSAGGVALEGGFKIDGADLARLGSAARGKASIELRAASEANSPSGLMALLAGSGTATLQAAQVPAPGPSAGADVVAAVLAKKIANDPDDLADALKAAVATARTDLGQQSIPFTITGGVAKFDAITLEADGGNVKAQTVVDLASLAVDSAWKLAANVAPLPAPAEPIPGWTAPAPKPALPPATVVYTGNLAELSSLAVAVDAADMQRELAVRMIERNVEELERMKLQDQHRARLEQERRQALEAERAAAAAAAAAAKAGGAGLPPPAAQPPLAPPVPPGGASALPPVLPESAGTAPPVQGAPSSPNSAAPVAPGAAAPGVEGAAPPAVTVENAPITPAGERPANAARPQPQRPAAPRPAQARRTTSDEVMRSLGGYP